MKRYRDYKIPIDEYFQDSVHYQKCITDEGISRVNDCYEDVYEYELSQFIENETEAGKIQLYKGYYWKLMEVRYED